MDPFLANIRIIILMLLQNAYSKGFLEWKPHNDLASCHIMTTVIFVYFFQKFIN